MITSIWVPCFFVDSKLEIHFSVELYLVNYQIVNWRKIKPSFNCTCAAKLVLPGVLPKKSLIASGENFKKSWMLFKIVNYEKFHNFSKQWLFCLRHFCVIFLNFPLLTSEKKYIFWKFSEYFSKYLEHLEFEKKKLLNFSIK